MANTITFTASTTAQLAMFDGRLPTDITGRTWTNIVVDMGTTITTHASGAFADQQTVDGQKQIGVDLTTAGGDVFRLYFRPDNAIGTYITTTAT